ncbi:MAG: hypothetical protein KBT20_05815 [Bacteroidales bacterium]|nr:hypothetical protein [Candidatus Liminaster caballi]
MLKRIINNICLVAMVAVLSCFEIVPAFAQSSLPDKKFRIMDATSDENSSLELLDGEIKLGIDHFTGAGLEGLKVYVMFSVGADSLIQYQRDNAKTAKLNAYIQHYEEKQYLLHPDRDGVFSISEANWIAEELYNDFKPLIDYWIENSMDQLTPYSVALVVYHDSKGSYEKHNIEPILNNNSTDTRACIYYKGARELAEQATSAKMKTGKIRRSTIVKGSNLPINENIEVKGKTNQRLVIDRVVEPCTFVEDLVRVQNDFAGNDEAKSLAYKILGHEEDADSLFRQIPFVFAGEKFQHSLYRRTAGVMTRDTMEYYRLRTNEILAAQMGARDFKIVDPDTVSFDLDHSLWNTACQYKDFESIKNGLLGYARRQHIDLPADGGRPLEVNESKIYTLEVDSALFGQLSRYVERGHNIAHRTPRLSSDQFIDGWISTYTDVVANPTDSVYYQVKNSSILALRDSAFNVMQEKGRATILSANNVDSIYKVRVNSFSFMDEFEKIFDVQNVQDLSEVNIFLEPEPKRTNYNWEFKMPNINKYYRMVHRNYTHDFIHVDTTSTVECPCDRATPLMFLTIGAGAASFDCPPLLPNNTVDDMKPISSTREVHTVDRSARLQFAKASSAIDRHLGKNDSLLAYISGTVDDILWVDDENGTSRRRIDSVMVLGVSSPEGGFQRNQELSYQRAQSLGNWISGEIGRMGGQSPRIVSHGQVAPWSEVADILWAKDSVGNAELVQKIRTACENNTAYESIQSAIGYTNGSNAKIEEVLNELRRTEVRFFYQDIQDPTEEMVVKYYRSGGDLRMCDAFYYWTMLTTDKLTKEEKLGISKFLLEFKEQRVKNFTRNNNWRSYDDYFDLVLPMAATLLVTDSINYKIYNTEILAPYIDAEERSQRGNSARYTSYKGETKVWKYINADFILYNQILSLLGKGDQNSLREADVLIQFLMQSPTTSEAFDKKYARKSLQDYLKCYTSDFLTDERLAESIAQTSVVNYYVVNMSIANQLLQQDGGSYSNERMVDCFRNCYSRLSDLKKEAEEVPAYRAACNYFTAVTEARYAEGILKDLDQKNEHYSKAVEALVELFKTDENATFIGRCQGDSYIRGIYRTQKNMSNGFDIYLEAVEAYINDYLTNENK